MSLFFFFVFFLLVENLFLPALIGPQEFLVTPLFLIALTAYGSNFKNKIFQALILLLLAEIFAGVDIGDYLVPFLAAVLVYFWLNKLLSINSSLRESYSLLGIVSSSLVILALLYLYSLFFIFLNSSYSISTTLSQWAGLLKTSSFAMFLWSLGLTFLFKYVLKQK